MVRMSRVRRPERPPLPALTERDRALLAQLAAHEPLATGRYLLASGELTFYLELDRGTEPAKRVGAKLATYTTALATDTGRERGNILLICHSQRRLQSLAAQAPQGPPWIWATTDSERYQLLPGLQEERTLDRLPLWHREPEQRPLVDCLGRRWQTWGQRQWHSRRAKPVAPLAAAAARPGFER